MAFISFRLPHAAVPQNRRALLERLKAIAGVRSIAQVDPDSDDRDIARMCVAETANETQVQSVAAALRQAGSEAVEVEARRGLN